MNAMGVMCALGRSAEEVRANLFCVDAPGGVIETERYAGGRVLPLGCLPDGPLPSLEHLPMRLRSRNNALAAATLAQIRPQVDAAISRFGASRVAIVLGTSTSGVEEGERAARALSEHGAFPPDYDYAQQEMGNVALFMARELGVSGPAYVISTACSSGAKALASAARLLRAGMVDAVVAGGIDALCSFTVAGFSALESVSSKRCNPLSANRDGINIGEGAALFLLSRDDGPLRLAGWGESSDAHHMSAPDPSGIGAIAAMRGALERAGLTPGDIDYVNLHGTATRHNDAMESLAVAEVFNQAVPCSSTKPLTGHTLAAAGAIEAALAWMTLVDNPDGLLPPHWWDGVADPEITAIRLAAPGEALGRPLRHVLSNSFAFGGSNASLLFAAV